MRRIPLAAVVCSLVSIAAAGCTGIGSARGDRAYAHMVSGGDPHRGAQAIRAFGCGSCHVIPGIRGADGLVGPPLTNMAQRTYIAGRLPNRPDAMVRWVLAPRSVDELTAMPNVGLNEQQARDVAAYLYTLY